jgi:hypothetical protein
MTTPIASLTAASSLVAGTTLVPSFLTVPVGKPPRRSASRLFSSSVLDSVPGPGKRSTGPSTMPGLVSTATGGERRASPWPIHSRPSVSRTRFMAALASLQGERGIAFRPLTPCLLDWKNPIVEMLEETAMRKEMHGQRGCAVNAISRTAIS